MNDEEVARSIAAVERALTAEDPAFVHRVDHMARRDALHALVVGVLLASGAVLLTAGFGTMSGILWGSGLGLLVLTVVVDAAYQRRLRRSR